MYIELVENIIYNDYFKFLLQFNFFLFRKYEYDIRTYEGDDPLRPRYEYIKWLEQVNLQNGPHSNLLPLIEETVQRFKNDLRYKQDLRFVEILINFVSIFLFYLISY